MPNTADTFELRPMKTDEWNEVAELIYGEQGIAKFISTSALVRLQTPSGVIMPSFMPETG